MAIAKSKGGLGFRDLHGFNIALLGKHVWNFSRNPDSLVTRIFKSRYFPDSHILQAGKGNDSSFIWSGIWEEKENLKRGFRWVLGDGKEIKIFRDPWLQGKGDFRVEDNHLNVVRNENVCCYFHPNSKVWDVHKVEHNFHRDDCKLILQTRIPQNDVKDRIAWTGSNKGFYTVKSGYMYWASQNTSIDNNIESQGWNKLWNMQVPHKLRVFMWRFYRNNIPVRYLLRGKGVETTIVCPMCGIDIEHVRHLFFECLFAVECWQKVGLSFDMSDVEYASSWLLDVISKENAYNVQKMAIVLSGIWFSRNKKIWEEKIISPAITIDLSSKQVQDWQEANRRRYPGPVYTADPSKECQVVWQPPLQGQYKLNVDASLYKGEGMFTLGMVLRNDAGVFVMGKVMKVAGEVSVMEAEARGVLEAIQWIDIIGIHNVIIESDSQMVVQALQIAESYQLEVGHILDECKMKVKNRADLSVFHVKKQANRAAHLMARVPCLLDNFNCFMSPPEMLVEMLPSDFSN